MTVEHTHQVLDDFVTLVRTRHRAQCQHVLADFPVLLKVKRLYFLEDPAVVKICDLRIEKLRRLQDGHKVIKVRVASRLVTLKPFQSDIVHKFEIFSHSRYDRIEFPS